MRSNLCRSLLMVCTILVVISCSKKTQPSQTVVSNAVRSDTVAVIKKMDSVVVAAKPVIKRKPKESVPKVMVVNDKFAKRSVDGRYYYDLQGHRYWRSNKDGKYYLFNKSMLTDEAFKKPN